jgi:hypothetical protein
VSIAGVRIPNHQRLIVLPARMVNVTCLLIPIPIAAHAFDDCQLDANRKLVHAMHGR